MYQKYEEEIKKLKHQIHQLRQVIGNVEANVYWKDEKGRYLGMNKALFLNPLNWKKVDKISIEI
ncbi:hypothetical protein [Francisella sp. TX07-6608]|uniref:hypothetical protein n=1 Tax=Francisella sp. TX07-6608 TaxID=573568 RepID=UPI0008F9C5A8|nr:hypothetical protein [Francisella sp. TX07-6608]OIN85088.1 hypothetical protein KX00_2134 [Francisella sp. TX07-6608]